jgi:hypothetical protein
MSPLRLPTRRKSTLPASILVCPKTARFGLRKCLEAYSGREHAVFDRQPSNTRARALINSETWSFKRVAPNRVVGAKKVAPTR